VSNFEKLDAFALNISTAEVLVYIQNTNTNDIANVVEALAERIKGNSKD